MPVRRALFLVQASEAVRALPPDVKRRIRAEVDALKVEPNRGEPLGGELTGFHRARVGRYRSVFRIDAAAIVIVAVGPRRSIYIDLERAHWRSEARGVPASRVAL